MSDKKYKGSLPKPKPTKVERLLNKRVKGEKGPYIPKIGDLNEMGPMIIDTKTGKQVKRLKKGGATFPDLTGDGKVTKKDILKGRGVKGFEEGGNVISDADKKRIGGIKKIRPIYRREDGKTISDADAKRLKKMPLYKSEHGKSISDADFEKLRKYEGGGEVRGMGKAYQGGKRSCKVR